MLPIITFFMLNHNSFSDLFGANKELPEGGGENSSELIAGFLEKTSDNNKSQTSGKLDINTKYN